MAEDDVKRLVFSIMKFLNKQKANNQGEVLEQIEVAQQFLESAYGFTLDDSAVASQYDVPKDLLDIFVGAVGSASAPPPSAEELESRKSRAEERKTKGNELMKSERYEEALAAYTDAISLNKKNAVYFCNRAAAHSKLGNHEEAVEDCVTALEIDPTYSKAYGRMGLAFSALGRHDEALDRYKKALQLDPSNESYKNNMKIAEEKSRDASSPAGGTNPMANLANMFGGGGGMPGGMPPGMPDMTSLLANPQLMSMATQMMQNPEVQNLMTSLMAGGGGGGGGGMGGGPASGGPASGGPASGGPAGGGPAGGESGPPGGMDNLLRAGQQLAEQLQSSNPELVAQLRQQMGGGGGSGGTNNEGNEESGKGPEGS